MTGIGFAHKLSKQIIEIGTVFYIREELFVSFTHLFPVQAVKVFELETGRVLEVWTTQPGMQLYTGNFLDGSLVGKRGVRYVQYSGLCLETQHFPDAVHHPNFPSIILRPDGVYRHTALFRFGVRSDL